MEVKPQDKSKKNAATARKRVKMSDGAKVVIGGTLFIIFVRLIVPGLSFTEYLISTTIGISAVIFIAMGTAALLNKSK